MKATNLFPKWANDELEYQRSKLNLLKKANNEQYKGSYYFGIKQMAELREQIISLIELQVINGASQGTMPNEQNDDKIIINQLYST
jgi:hypothetical protein